MLYHKFSGFAVFDFKTDASGGNDVAGLPPFGSTLPSDHVITPMRWEFFLLAVMVTEPFGALGKVIFSLLPLTENFILLSLDEKEQPDRTLFVSVSSSTY